MPDLRFTVDDKQYQELTEIKEKLGMEWKGLMLFGADKLDGETEVSTPDTPQFLGLTYNKADDRRVFPDPKDDRLGAFKGGWTKAANGDSFEDSTYESLSWHNLGWRLGRLFDYNSDHDTSGALKREIYMWCVKQQVEAAEELPDREDLAAYLPDEKRDIVFDILNLIDNQADFDHEVDPSGSHVDYQFNLPDSGRTIVTARFEESTSGSSMSLRYRGMNGDMKFMTSINSDRDEDLEWEMDVTEEYDDLAEKIKGMVAGSVRKWEESHS